MKEFNCSSFNQNIELKKIIPPVKKSFANDPLGNNAFAHLLIYFYDDTLFS